MRLKYLLLIFLIICFPFVSYSQTHVFPATDTNNVFTGQNSFPTIALGSYTVATLPAAASLNPGSLAIVTDSATGCTVGGGNATVLCRDENSTNWVVVGGSGGGGGGTPGGSSSNVQYNDSGAFGGAAGLLTDGNSLRIKGPIPWIDFTTYMPAGGCGMTYPTFAGESGTMTAGSPTLTMTTGWYVDFKNGCYVGVERAGTTAALTAPATPSATSIYTAGSSTIQYGVVAIDNDQHVSPVSSTVTFTTSTAYGSLSQNNFNFLDAGTVATAVMYCWYSDKGAGGTFSSVATAIGCSPVPGYEDHGYVTPVPSFLPLHPPASNQPGILVSKVLSGGGTATVTLTDNAVASVSAQRVDHADQQFLLNAYNGASHPIGKILIPEGYWGFSKWPAIQSSPISLSGTIILGDMPLTGSGLANNSIDGSAAGEQSPQGSTGWSQANIQANDHVPWVIGGTLGGFSMKNVGLTNVFGDGWYVGEGGGIGAQYFSVSQDASAHGCAVRIDNNVIIFNMDHYTLIGSELQASGGAVCLSGLANSFNDYGLSFTNGWMVNHSFTVVNPNFLGNPAQAIIVDNLQTEGQWEPGIFFVNSTQQSLLAPRILNANIDNNRFSSTYYSSFYCNQGNSCVNSPILTNVAPSVTVGYNFTNTTGMAGASDISLNGGPSYKSDGSLSWSMFAGQQHGGSFGLNGSSGYVGGPLALNFVGTGASNYGSLSVILPPPSLESVTPGGGGSLSAGTYYYKITTLDALDHESYPSNEVSATVGASGSVAMTILDYQIGGNNGRYRLYRGTSPGMETGYLSITTGYNTVYTDTGASLTAGSPPTAQSSYISNLIYGGRLQPSYLLAGNGTEGMPYNPLGIGDTCYATDKTTTGTGSCIATGEKLRIGGGYLGIKGSTSGYARIGVAAAAGTPNPIILPTDTASVANRPLVSDAGSPQQTSWGSTLNLTTLQLVEGSAPSGVSSTDVIYGDSSTHQLKTKLNNGSALFIPTTDGSGVSGHCAQFTSTYEIIDNGSACGSGGTGTVTNFSADDITTGSQNFATQAVTNPGTTPNLTFTLANAPAHKFFMNNTAGAAAPDYQTAGKSDLPATAVYTDQINTFGAFLQDLTASTFKAPVSAGAVTTANGNQAYDTTNKNWHFWQNGADKLVGIWSAAPTNGQCVTATVAASVVNLTGAACSGATLQTNGVSNSSQTLLNFTNTSGGSGVGGITFSNPSGGVESATIANVTGGGNSVLMGTLTGAVAGDYICENSSPILVNCTPGVVPNAQTGTTYTVLTGDRGKYVSFSNASSIAVTLPQSGTTGFAGNFFFATKNIGAGVVTITPTTSTINGAATLVLLKGQQANIFSDNTNYFATISGQPQALPFASLPTCSSTYEGMYASVTDSSTTTWGATITGSSSSHVGAYCNGTNWTVAAK